MRKNRWYCAGCVKLNKKEYNKLYCHEYHEKNKTKIKVRKKAALEARHKEPSYIASRIYKCTKCKKTFPRPPLGKCPLYCKSCWKQERNRQGRESYKRNKTKYIEARASWKKRHPKAAREYHLKIMYGLTLDDYNNLLLKQNGRCAGCNELPDGSYNKSLCVDHDHATGVVRGLLCQDCNSSLGHVKDSITTLKNLITYLNNTNST